MSDKDAEPLLERVNALLSRHQQPLRSPDDDVPVLTEVACAQDPPPRTSPRQGAELDAASVDALVAGIKREVLEALAPRIDGLLANRLAPLLSASITQALAEARTELTEELGSLVRDAVARAVSRALQVDRNTGKS